MASKRFINEPDDIVTEALEGLLALDPDLVRLDAFPHIKVVARAELDPTKVALVSGGGSGHEPAHAGFVGPGLLSAAVCGELFASPSVEAVYAGIMAVTGDAGCLLIVKNYTGDRLNFGLAAERARAAGKQVETVLVADDIALPGSSNPRGVAGTLFVHKLAGHLARSGASLEAIAAAARSLAAEVRSLGVSLEGCTIPGQPATEQLAADEGELGLGIHGEPGVEKIALQSVRSIVALMSERLEASLGDDSRPLAAMINNLGSVPAIEMSVVAHELLRSRLAERIELVIGPAALMTSLDMNGFSLSLVPLDDARRAALCSTTPVLAWPRPRPVGPVRRIPAPSRSTRASAPASSDAKIHRALAGLLDRLIAARDELDQLDARIGDGDTGSTLARAAESLRGQLDGLPLAQPAALLREIGDRLAETMGGSLGVLLSIFCTATGSALDTGTSWAEALDAGVERVQEYGGAQPGDRTMLDALVPALAHLREGGDLTAAARAADSGAEATAAMTRARAGRAAYLGDQVEGVRDPGAVAVALALAALAEAN